MQQQDTKLSEIEMKQFENAFFFFFNVKLIYTIYVIPIRLV